MHPQDSAELSALYQRALARLSELPEDPASLAKVEALAVASDFAIETLRRQPTLLSHLLQEAATPLPAPQLAADAPEKWQEILRRHRSAESTRLVWRDVVEGAPVEEILVGSTRLAEQCLQLGLEALEVEFAQRHGVVRAEDGSVQRLVVFGLGKLGGGELNFSSDVDLVYCYPQGGESDGVRALAAEEYFARLGQRLARLLDDPTADGFCHRVDLRLRPFGNAGRVALSFAGMDVYFQREGRDWERYAWMKARAVAGDIAAGEAWLLSLRPFVYRRYLDYTALDGLREMKAAIAAEVARRELADDIKRGPGGIREIEFLAQALQLIRGGREAHLRKRGLLPALRALIADGQIEADNGAALTHAYLFLRKLENRLQMLSDAQTHALPEGALDRARIASGLGYADWNALLSALATQRALVSTEFAQLLAPRRRDAQPGALGMYWRTLPDGGDSLVLANAGFEDVASADAALRDFAQSSGVRGLSDAARARLDRVVPGLLEAAAQSRQPDAALKRALGLLQSILRRTSYLALLDEQPSALARLVNVLARSALLSERLAMYPVLLDELLDTRVGGPLADREGLRVQIDAAVGEGDTEQQLRAINERRQALSFRIALAALDGRQAAGDSTRQLAWLADAVVQTVLRMAEAEVQAAHGHIAGGRFAAIGYGSLGGEELGFGSDLDLVFLYDAPSESESNGARPLDAARWYTRLAQKLVALLGAQTGGGRLFDVDTRLRPDGSKSMLVTSLASYREYQQERAWTWEHQALVRARDVAGDDSLRADFENIRSDVLRRVRDTKKLRDEVVSMRARMRGTLDRSEGLRFDLKQGAGGLVDLEFLLQYLVLAESGKHTSLVQPRNSAALIVAAMQGQLLSANAAAALADAHAVFLREGLECTLDRRPRIVTEDESIGVARHEIAYEAKAVGLDFDAAPAVEITGPT